MKQDHLRGILIAGQNLTGRQFKWPENPAAILR
jgi:hypothetical protein